MSTFDPKGPLASMQFDLWLVTLWVTTVIFVIVGGLLAYATWKFRERKGETGAVPEQVHGNALVELGTIIFSVVSLVFIAVPTLEGIWLMHDLPTKNAKGMAVEPMEVTVNGYQWWWSFDYPAEGITTANELVIPVDRVVKLNLRSQDVIHSFWVPKIAGKTDLMPGRQNWMWLEANEVGHYYGMCAEFCGDSHSRMYFRVNVLSAEDYAAWVAKYQTGAPSPDGTAWSTWHERSRGQQGKPAAAFASDVDEGAHLFYYQAGCTQCHAVNEAGTPAGQSVARNVVGPSLTHVAGRASLAAGIFDHRADPGEELSPNDPAKLEENLFQWIYHSQDYKPGNLMYQSIRKTHYTPDQRADLVRRLGEDGVKGLEETGLTEEQYRKIARFLATLK